MYEGYKRLNKTKLSNRKHSTISTVKALKDITPIQWSESILQGTSKVQIDKRGMCQIGDIIIINQYKDENNIISKHSFIVIDDDNGTIQGLPYDFVANALSFFKNDNQKKRKLSYYFK